MTCDRPAFAMRSFDALPGTQLRARRNQSRSDLTSPEFSRPGRHGDRCSVGVHRASWARRCAIKVLPLDKSDDLALREVFHREIRLQARSNWSVTWVAPFDAVREGMRAFLVTEIRARHRISAGLVQRERLALSIQTKPLRFIAQSRCGGWGLCSEARPVIHPRHQNRPTIMVTPRRLAKVATSFSRR